MHCRHRTQRSVPRTPFQLLSLLVCALGTACWPTPVAAAEWTHYRGPNHDGSYLGPFRSDWSTKPPKLLWRKTASPALSSITVSSGRLFTQARRRVGAEDREFAIALDAATGRELWAVNLDLADYPDGGVGSDDGPRSTPVVDGDRVFVFTSRLRLYALDAATGRQLWLRDFHNEFNATIISWQNAASPLVLGDLVLVNANTGPNRLTAVRKSDGTTAWRRHDDRMTQATPIAATLAGIPHAIFYTQTGLVAVRPESGDLLWRFSLPYLTSTAASPVVDGDLVYASAAYSAGSGVVRITAAAAGSTPTTTQRWKKRSFNMNHWATGVAHQGHIYSVAGQDSTSLRCIATDAGEERWRTSTVGSGEVGYGSILKTADLLFVLTESGEAVLVRPTPTAYEELQRLQVVQGKTWNSPALNNGILYARSTTEIAAWEIVQATTPPSPPILAPAVSVTPGRTRLTVRAADGSPIPASRASAFSLIASEDPATPIAAWLTLPTTPRLVDGAVELDDTTQPTPARRFYRTRENP